jgi:hypothetical protein
MTHGALPHTVGSLAPRSRDRPITISYHELSLSVRQSSCDKKAICIGKYPTGLVPQANIHRERWQKAVKAVWQNICVPYMIQSEANFLPALCQQKLCQQTSSGLKFSDFHNHVINRLDEGGGPQVPPPSGTSAGEVQQARSQVS